MTYEMGGVNVGAVNPPILPDVGLDGRWSPAAGGQSIAVTDPATGGVDRAVASDGGHRALAEQARDRAVAIRLAPPERREEPFP